MAKTKAKPEKPTKNDKQHELQEKYIEVQVLKQQVNSFVEQKQSLDEKENEIKNTIDALQKLTGVKKDEMWSSLGSGTFLRSDVKDTEKVLIAIGAGVVSKETIPDAVKLLESRLTEVQAVIQQIVVQANAMVERINVLEPEMEKLAKGLE